MDIVKTVDKLNKPRLFELNDRVIHKLTRLTGRVEATERIAGTDGQMLTVALDHGATMRGIRSTEFGLNTARIAVQRPDPAVEGVQSGRWEASPEVTGPIDGRSLLDELC